MATTVLSLIQQACYAGNIPAPTAVAAATDVSTQQLKHLFYDTGRELRQARWWPQLKRTHSVILQTNRGQYQLPQDFYAALPATNWDQGNKWEMIGPMSDREWDYRLYGYITIENRKAFRVFGPDINPSSNRGQFQVNPVPDDALAGLILTFEYISKSWLLPPNWLPSTAGYLQNAYVNVNGNIYKKSDSGSDTSGTTPMTVDINNQGQDGGVFWTALTTTALSSPTAYLAGSYATNGGTLYLCTTSGITSGSGTVSGTTYTDGTAVFEILTVGTWSAATSFGFGDYVLIGSTYFLCSTPGVQGNNIQMTGTVQPNWGVGFQTDNTITWVPQNMAYETIVTDSDLCLFDDDIMIAGLKWRFMRSRGLEYDDARAEYELLKDTTMSRWNAGRKISFADNGIMLPIRPNIPEGGFGG